MSNITLYTSSADDLQKRLVSRGYTVIKISSNCLSVSKEPGNIYCGLSYTIAKAAEQLMLVYETEALLKEVFSIDKNIRAITKNINFALDKKSTARMSQEIEDILRRGNELNIDGYILFQMKPERAAAREAATAVIKNLLVRHEYEKFIENLSYYVQSSEQHEAELHIIPHRGRYKLINSQKADLTASSLANYLAEVAPNEINYDDWLVGALLDLLPAKIIIHQNKKIANKNILTTIATIFKGKVSFC